MSVLITGVEKGSAAARRGIVPGDLLLSLNGHEIADVLDYRFYMTERKLSVVVKKADGKEKEILIRKDEYDDIGLEFETYLMDSQRSCRNNCIFCFIDQMPPGMRETLYFKDDDSRLSFLYGNYITLTNLSPRDVDRIIEMHLSPINVSVHTMNPELRCKMMNNRFAGQALDTLRRLAENGISLNTQLVLCPGYNDGEELRYSLEELRKLTPALKTVSCVPVGLTKYREKLTPLRPFTKEEAAATIEMVERFAAEQFEETGERVFYCGDEFYLLAERELPSYDYYGEFTQLENGVGLMALMKQEFLDAIPDFEADEEKRHFSVATGKLAAPFLQQLIDEAKKKWHNLTVNVYPIENEFFGPLITVAGLITGGDLIKGLKGKELGERVYIPSVMLKYHQNVFLDDLSVEDVEHALGVSVVPIETDGYSFLEAVLDRAE